MSSDPPERPPRVFISYSHDSEAHAQRVLELANRLRSDYIDAWIDQYETAPSLGWPRWMEDQVEQADFVLCVCTETYRRRFDQKETPDRGIGVTWEGALVRIGLYLDQGENRKFLSTLFEAGDGDHIPTPLKAFHRFHPTDPTGYEELRRHLTGQPKTKPPPLGAPPSGASLPSRVRRSLFGEPVDTVIEDSDPLSAYEDWARDHYAHLDLIGIDAGDVKVDLDEVYVPLRVIHHRSREADGLGMIRGLAFGAGLCGEEKEPTDIGVEAVLRQDAARHALIFGEPGSGKTTALLKLHHLAWRSATDLGLAEGTLPVFLRLRHLDKELLDQGLAAFIEQEVRQVSGGRLSGLGQALWDHRRLLLLFDGLDEIADAAHRAKVLRRISWNLCDNDAKEVRAIISCRRVGLPGRIADRDALFQPFEVRPFQNEQIAQLVTQWFRELARRGRIDQATADRRVNTILTALNDRQKANQQILEMASNPLLLTLLCVVVLQGDEIPKKRVRFFEQCLDVMLDRWPRQRGKPGPVDLNTAREALAHLAFFLHTNQRRDDLTWTEAVLELMTLLGDAGEAEEFFDWAHRDVGLLVDFTDEEYGFVHLGIQEHLTARYLVAHPNDFEFLTEDFEESWWREVFLQLSALSERAGFDALMSQLLEHTDVLERRAGLLHECLKETRSPGLAAFIRVLDEGNPTRQEAVLRLLGSFSFRAPEWHSALEKVAEGPDSRLSETARHILRQEKQPEGSQLDEDFALMIQNSTDVRLAKILAARLAGWRGGWSAKIFEGTGRATAQALKAYRVVLVLLGADPEGWLAAPLLRRLHQTKPWLAVTLPGEPRPNVPEVFSDCDVLDWRLGEEDALVEAIVKRLPSAPREAKPEATLRTRSAPSRQETLGSTSPMQPFTDPVSGTEFLPVPGGSFTMGSNDLLTEEEQEQFRENDLDWVLKAPTPACQVRLSPFWLARTPVTNEQYGRFLAATNHVEPSTWRDRRFSAADQPVVSVSWKDAVAYCHWLSETNAAGHVFQLPSEAQWEFAARGPKSRKYPWGETSPTPTLACYGLDSTEDKPASVGSFPEGAGPFGHLDMAGLVWEWCRDAWEPDHSRWVQGEPLDPVGDGDPDQRPLRGGAWVIDADVLRSAFRNWVRPRSRHGFIGFRLLWCPLTP